MSVDDDTLDDETWVAEPDPDDEVGTAVAAFALLVPLAPDDAALAAIAVAAVVRSLRDANGPDSPSPGMMGVPNLIEDGLARAALADASPAARETLGDLELAVARLGPRRTAAAAARIRAGVRAANDRLDPRSA